MQVTSKNDVTVESAVEDAAITSIEVATDFHAVRDRTMAICAPLRVEDHVVQPVVDVSPPKWHLGHTTWFYEQFILKGAEGYKPAENHRRRRCAFWSWA